MRAELASLNDCAVPFLSRATVNLCWYYYSVLYIIYYVSNNREAVANAPQYLFLGSKTVLSC